MRTVIVDYSVLMHQSWHQIFSENYLPTYKTELEEYLFNLSKNIFYIKSRFLPDELIFALDGDDNWRKHFVKRYYDKRIKLFIDNNPELKHETYYMRIEDTNFKFERFLATGQWNKTKVPKFPEGLEIVEDYELTDMWKMVGQYSVPYYKAQRKLTNWVSKVITKEEWKKFSWSKAKEIASVFNASVIQVKYAEGDDIIAVLVQQLSANPKSEVIVVSIDQDLIQLTTMHNNFKYYNPVKHEIIKTDPESARFKLACKIAGGDVSDNIEGVRIDGKCLGEVSFTAEGTVKNGIKTVAKINQYIEDNLKKGVVGSKLFEDFYAYLEGACEDNTFYKNLVLIYLKNIPEELVERIEYFTNNRKVEPSKFTFADLGISPKDKISVMNKARNEGKDDFL